MVVVGREWWLVISEGEKGKGEPRAHKEHSKAIVLYTHSQRGQAGSVGGSVALG